MRKTPADPCQRLEKNTTSVRRWAHRQSRRTHNAFPSRKLAKYESRARRALCADDALATPHRNGTWVYCFTSDSRHPRGLWRRTLAKHYGTKPMSALRWHTVLDVGRLNTQEKRSWIVRDIDILSPDGDRALITLSDANSNTCTIREFDISKQKFLTRGFLASADCEITARWLDRQHILITSAIGAQSLTAYGNPRQIRYWRRGTSLAKAPVVLECDADDVGVEIQICAPTPHWPEPRIHGIIHHDLERRRIYRIHPQARRWRRATPQALSVPDFSRIDIVRNWIILTLQQEWSTATGSYPAGSVLAMPYQDACNGAVPQEIHVLFTGTPHSTITEIHCLASGVLILATCELKPVIRFAVDPHTQHDPAVNTADRKNDRRPWYQVDLTPAHMEHLHLRVIPVDAGKSDEIWLQVDGFLTPSALYCGTVNATQLRLHRIGVEPHRFSAPSAEVRLCYAQSADGTAVPYYLVGPYDSLEGKRPTRVLLETNSDPSVAHPAYRSALGTLWLGSGYVYALALGRAKYPTSLPASTGEPRRPQSICEHSVPDFVAVAEDLLARGITSADKLAGIGTAHNALVIGNAYHRYPTHFAALAARMPLLDLSRTTVCPGDSADAALPPSSADKSRDNADLCCPYHQLDIAKQSDPAQYPPLLLTTSTYDGCASATHARCFHARARKLGHASFFWENPDGGRTGYADPQQLAHLEALTFTFFDEKLAR
ncbi:prolyl oligopeptidase family serine peptidase [Trueperella sp. LYQ143]|uniref:prolyl oligopeptidase family serine peptidase n=1 Tax=Trueperella sp. LYQ143 TaxID=3391059 RepID=UPI003982ED48